MGNAPDLWRRLHAAAATFGFRFLEETPARATAEDDAAGLQCGPCVCVAKANSVFAASATKVAVPEKAQAPSEAEKV